MATYIIIGITVILSYICFNNKELFGKLALSPYRIARIMNGIASLPTALFMPTLRTYL